MGSQGKVCHQCWGGFVVRVNAVFGAVMQDLRMHDVWFIYMPYSARAYQELV